MTNPSTKPEAVPAPVHIDPTAAPVAAAKAAPLTSAPRGAAIEPPKS